MSQSKLDSSIPIFVTTTTAFPQSNVNTVEELINILKTVPKDMPVRCNYAVNLTLNVVFDEDGPYLDITHGTKWNKRFL